ERRSSGAEAGPRRDETGRHGGVERHNLILGRFFPEQFVHLFHFVRVLGGKVVGLRPVVSKVIEFVWETGRILTDRTSGIPRWTHDLGASDPAIVIDGVVAHHFKVLRVVL